MDTKFLNWFLAGGSVSLPKRMLAYMAPLGLSFEELGEVVYLMSLEGRMSQGDIMAKTAAQDLVQKRLITYNPDTGDFSLTPLFDKMFQGTTAGEEARAQGNSKKESDIDTLVAVVKRYEKEKGLILSPKVRSDLSEVILRYGWDSDLTYLIYDYYYSRQRQHYNFLSFAQMAHNAGVNDQRSLKNFVLSLDYEVTKVREILRLLGKRNAPTEAQRALYNKWNKEWQFSQEMIIMATDDTTGADNPSMNYLDSILASWHAMGITTPAQVEAMRAKKRAPKRTTAQKRTNNRYVSQEGPRDFSDLEE